MKTSNKLLIAIGVLIAASIILFDTALRAEYIKGDYKGHHYNEMSLPLKDFDAIENNTVSETFTDISQTNGFEVWATKGAENDLTFKVENRVLKINFKTVSTDKPRNYVIHIFCPRLNSLSTNFNPGAKAMYIGGNTLIGILRQDSLRITSNAPSPILLSTAFSLKKLNVTLNVGELKLGSNSSIDTANFDIRGDSKLTIGDNKIAKANYKCTDSAQVILTGHSAQQLMH